MLLIMKTQYVLSLKECTADRAGRIGGKALGLGIMLNQGLAVPPGFTVTTDAYRACVATAGLTDRISGLLDKTPNTREASALIKALFRDDMLTDDVAAAITEAYERLGGSDVAVAVRSSATAEDAADASFAGQQETYLWIRGAAEVRRHVVRCWASLFTQRAIDYRSRISVPLEGLAMGVVVQQMVPAEAAGVIMTLHPVSGDRSQIYIESAFGLGEIVVRGEVEADRFCVDKGTLSIRSEELGDKERAYHFDEKHGVVRLVDVPPSERKRRSLSEKEVRATAELAKRVEGLFGKPMDIEWAIASSPNKGSRELFLLQARPETVWSNKPAKAGISVADVRGRHDEWDPLQSWSDPGEYWTTSSMGEAIPGVATPLCWSLWGNSAEHAARESVYRMGLLTRTERRVPDRMQDRFIQMFYGRAACKVEFQTMIGDRMPGTTGERTAVSVFGRVPEDMGFRPTKRRYPIIALRFPWTFFITPRLLRKAESRGNAWYEEAVVRVPDLNLEEAVALFREAAEWFDYTTRLQADAMMCVSQVLLGALAQVVESTGVGEFSILASHAGGPELDVVLDIWKASRGQLEFEKLIRKQGFHGPGEGELSSHTWREDGTPLRSMLNQFAALDDSEGPELRQRERQRQREELERQIINATSLFKRPAVRLLFRLARKNLIYRGVGKESFLQAFDVCRACARRIGAHLAAAGKLEDPEDVFYLTVAELTGELPRNARELVALRRERRDAYQRLEIPPAWKGMPEATPVKETAEPGVKAEDVIKGVGVSAGIVEGTACVAMSSATEIEPGQILVAPTTDPSWTSIMFVSLGLVVDIGGAMSHAAIVARELGIPCVVNTRTGTKILQSGDRVQVDGSKGTVKILKTIAETG